MNNSLALAAAHLKQAKDHLSLVKAQYQSAEKTYESAKSLFEALESSQTIHEGSNAQHSRLCESCKAIPIRNIFQQQPASRPPRRKVGDLFHAVETQSSCVFCKFLVEAFQIGSEDQSPRLDAQLSPRDTAIYFTSDPDGKAWYTKAGIEIGVPACPFVWLQTGPQTVTGQPHICVSFEPAFSNDENVRRSSNKKVYPRQRGELEAFNGSINYDLVKSWLWKCCAEHGAKCQKEDAAAILTLDIYLVDVYTKSFVRRRTGDRFVALSYVWGKCQRTASVSVSYDYTAPDRDEDDQTSPEVIQKLPTIMPQTMVDAMTFVNRVGERYLWIDQLCIDQTNGEEKQRQINAMDQIFASAYLIIVGMDGPDADWGLPGISRPLQQTQQPMVTLESGRLMATFIYSSWDNNGNSIWDSRGWTLQERLLSQRCIIFAKTYISMTCCTEFFHECLALNPGAEGVTTRLSHDYFREDGSSIRLDDIKWDFENYDALVSVFTSRKLTLETDVLNACRGSLNRLSQAAVVEFCFGLPMHDCLRALIWVPHSQNTLTRRFGFPSWSWTGWTGRIEYGYWVGDMAAYLAEDPAQQVHRHGPSLKRKRMHLTETSISHPERAEVMSHPTSESHSPVLQIKTTVAKFKLQLVRRDCESHRLLKSSSLQSKKAIGDHWTLVGQDGNALRDVAGEYQCFELTDAFFRLKPEYSQLLIKQNYEADFMFVEHWPRIRDSAASNQWLYDMVSALLVIRNADGTAWRLASVLLKGEDWYAKMPLAEDICLV